MTHVRGQDRRPSDFEPDEAAFADGLVASGVFDPDAGCPRPSLLLGATHQVLPEPLQAQITTHLARCQWCQQLVRDLGDAALGEPTTEEIRRIEAALPQPGDAGGGAGSRGRPQRLSQLALAASLLLAVGLGAWNLSLQYQARALREQVAQARAVVVTATPTTPAPLAEPPQVNVDVVDLEPRSALRAAGPAPARVTLARADRIVTLLLSSNSASAAAAGGGQPDDYAIEIRDGATTRWRASGLRRTALGTFTVLVPREALPDGRLTILLSATRAGQSRAIDEYDVVVASR